MVRLYDFLILMQVGLGGEGGAPPAPAAPAAEGAQPAGEQAARGVFGCGSGGMAEMLIWMVLLFGLMYFLLIRPQRKQQKKLEELQSSLKKGDKVTTNGGILGTIRGFQSPMVLLEIADGVVIRIRKEHIAGLHVETKTEEPGKS